MTFEEARNEIKKGLEKKGFYVEGKENEIVFSLTNIGLSSVYATIDEEEINYFKDNYEE